RATSSTAAFIANIGPVFTVLIMAVPRGRAQRRRAVLEPLFRAAKAVADALLARRSDVLFGVGRYRLSRVSHSVGARGKPSRSVGRHAGRRLSRPVSDGPGVRGLVVCPGPSAGFSRLGVHVLGFAVVDRDRGSLGERRTQRAARDWRPGDSR